MKRIRQEGDKGIVHKSRGKESSRKLPKKLTDKVVHLYQQKYQGFGPTLFCEKLEEIEGIHISDETARKWLIQAGLWEKKIKHKIYRQWRSRKEHRGEMVQMDGSHHDWFEGRGSGRADNRRRDKRTRAVRRIRQGIGRTLGKEDICSLTAKS